jgi:esterase/lipase superfamily enzyme
VTVPQLLKKADASAAARDESTDVSRIAIQQVAIESGDAFTASIDRALLASKIFHRRAFIFIHGYNVSFENAVRRAGQIAFDLDFDGPAFLFSWPSRGQILGYLADRDEVDVTAEHLKQFLKTYVLASKVESLHIVAHSMGNMVLLRAIEKMREDNSIAALPLGEIVTAAPDVDPDLYSQFVAKVASTGAHVTLYMSADDRALWLSSWLRGRPRAGFVLGAPSAIAGTETIDITGVPSVSWFALNHDVYASTPLIVGDMRGVFLGERPPDRRTKEFSRVDLGAQVFWKYRTEPKVER